MKVVARRGVWILYQECILKISKCVEKMKEGYNIVIMVRYAKVVKSEGDDIITGFGNWIFGAVINIYRRAYYRGPI